MANKPLTPSISGFDLVLLWENDSPGASFNAQDVQAPGLDSYEWLLISFSILYPNWLEFNTTSTQTALFKKGAGLLTGYVTAFAYRNFTTSGDTISFGDAKYLSAYSGSQYIVANQWLIPNAVYGLK